MGVHLPFHSTSAQKPFKTRETAPPLRLTTRLLITLVISASSVKTTRIGSCWIDMADELRLPPVEVIIEWTRRIQAGENSLLRVWWQARRNMIGPHFSSTTWKAAWANSTVPNLSNILITSVTRLRL